MSSIADPAGCGFLARDGAFFERLEESGGFRASEYEDVFGVFGRNLTENDLGSQWVNYLQDEVTLLGVLIDLRLEISIEECARFIDPGHSQGVSDVV